MSLGRGQQGNRCERVEHRNEEENMSKEERLEIYGSQAFNMRKMGPEKDWLEWWWTMRKKGRGNRCEN